MENEANRQLELFTQSSGPAGRRSPSVNNAFLAFIWNYEKTILLVIAMLITSIVSFSLGVEKGKRLTMLKDNPLATNQESPPDISGPKEQKEEVIRQSIPIEKGNYIIQLASYKVRTHAQKEAELLKKRGLEPLVLSKGSYIVLCVRSISNIGTARSLLSQLRKRYRDCYITRL